MLRRSFVQYLGPVSAIWLAGCGAARESFDGTSDSTPTTSTLSATETPRTPEDVVPELIISNLTSNTHYIEIMLGEFSSIPDGTGTPVESGSFVLNKGFELSASESIDLGEHRESGEHYKLVLKLNGNIVIDEFLDSYEGLTIKIVGDETVEIEHVFI